MAVELPQSVVGFGRAGPAQAVVELVEQHTLPGADELVVDQQGPPVTIWATAAIRSASTSALSPRAFSSFIQETTL